MFCCRQASFLVCWGPKIQSSREKRTHWGFKAEISLVDTLYWGPVMLHGTWGCYQGHPIVATPSSVPFWDLRHIVFIYIWLWHWGAHTSAILSPVGFRLWRGILMKCVRCTKCYLATGTIPFPCPGAPLTGTAVTEDSEGHHWRP